MRLRVERLPANTIEGLRILSSRPIIANSDAGGRARPEVVGEKSAHQSAATHVLVDLPHKPEKLVRAGDLISLRIRTIKKPEEVGEARGV